ncbi:hypothetical protein [Bacillus thuringiensis]|uniref:hypothetical protein n=1 Tax=Bacillus thuringiensis TaxID=1428 RepID=UPI000B29821B|nr:hypothetical protein [Bacillus thuringiensis]
MQSFCEILSEYINEIIIILMSLKQSFLEKSSEYINEIIEMLISLNFMEYSMNFIYFMNGIIKTIIPLSFTIFIFAYREQKEVAFSLFKRKKPVQLKIFLCFTAILILSNVFLIFDSKTVKKLSFWELLYLDVVSVIWIVFAGLSYIIILRNINILKEYDYNINKIEKAFKNIETALKNKKEWYKNDYTFSKELQKELLEINIASEICFQILTAKDKYKLSYDFASSLEKIDSVLIQKIIAINLNQEQFNKIVPCSGILYYNLYVSTLRYMNDLLEISFKGGKDTEVNKIIDNFNKIQPFLFFAHKDLKREWKVYRKINRKKTGVTKHKDLEELFKDFYDQYYYILYQVILTLYKNNDNRTARIFKSLLKREEQRASFTKNDLLALVTSLFIKALHKNNVKLLTDTTNVFLDLIQNSKSRKHNNTKVIGKKIKMGNITKSVRGYQEVENKTSRIIFFGIVKSIELGHYQSSGFLIKNFVKTFDFKDVKWLIEESFKDIDNNQPDLELSKNLTKVLSTKITFSKTSYEYCYLKAALLISIQQFYICSVKKIKVEKNKVAFIDLNYFFKDETYCYYSYLKSKIEGLNSLYGLLALENKNIKKFYKEHDI